MSVPNTTVTDADVLIDASGAVYLREGASQVAKYSADGHLAWTYTSSTPLGKGLFPIGSGTTELVGATYRDTAAAVMLAADGMAAGSRPIQGDHFGSAHNGYFIATDAGHYVRAYHSNGAASFTFGADADSSTPTHTGGPLHFYQLGGATRTASGDYLVTDAQHGIMLFSSDGLLLGSILPTDVDPSGLTQQSNIAIIGSNVYLTAGAAFSSNQYLVRLPLAQVVAKAMTSQIESTTLGIGAGFATGVTDNYFPATKPVVVSASFDPWWQSVAAGYSLCWTVRSRDQLVAGEPGYSGSLAGSSWQYGSSGTPLPIPQDLPPGGYQVKGTLVRDGTAVAATKMIFTVGAAGQSLSMDNLPAGADFGGPAPVRDVALAAELGTKTVRETLDWNRLLDHGTSAPLDFSSYNSAFDAAGAEAKQLGVTLIVQLGQGGPERALVDDGTWQQRVQEVVNHFKNDVTVWEAWNEPNATFGSGADYVTKVLAPVYRAVKAVDPTMTVVGGSVVGASVAYWQSIVDAGGLNYMDVASVHPYSGYNRSFEEEGTVPLLRQIKAMLVKNGMPVPLWITELAWWSDGDANIWDQADDSSRAMLWMAALGIDKWAYFLSEGGWGNDGVSFSAIQVNDYVKPAALALMTTSSQLAGRPFLGEVPLGVPSAFALRFGPRSNDPNSGDLLVAWTDGLPLPTALTAAQPNTTVMSTDDLGAPSTYTVNGPTELTLGSGPTFLQSPSGSALTITPTETFGTNLATAAAGASAAASSANPGNPASSAIDGDSTADGAGGLNGSPYWVSAPGDTNPSLTVTLAQPSLVDRVVVSTHSLGSVVPGLRDYTIQTRPSLTAPWSTVSTVQNQFYDRQALISFTTRTVAQFRVTVSAVNYSGTYDDGHRPTWWPTDTASLASAGGQWYGPAVIGEVAAYEPGTTTSLPSPGPTAPPTTTPPSPVLPSPTPPAKKPAPSTTPIVHPLLSVTAPKPAPVGTFVNIVAQVTSADALPLGLKVNLMHGGSTLVTRAVLTHSTTFAVRNSRTKQYVVELKNSDGAIITSRPITVVATRRTAADLRVHKRGRRKNLTGDVRWSPGTRRLAHVGVQLWVKRSGRWYLHARKITGSDGFVRFMVWGRNHNRWQLRIHTGELLNGVVALASQSRVI